MSAGSLPGASSEVAAALQELTLSLRWGVGKEPAATAQPALESSLGGTSGPSARSWHGNEEGPRNMFKEGESRLGKRNTDGGETW